MSKFGHQNLLRLKVAAGIAFLHESSVVETEHVMLADLIIADSLRVQRECEAIIGRAGHEAQISKAHAAERVAEQVADKAYAEKLKRLVGVAKGKVQKAEGEKVPWHDLRPAYRDRDKWNTPLWEELSNDGDLETGETGSARWIRWIE